MLYCTKKTGFQNAFEIFCAAHAWQRAWQGRGIVSLALLNFPGSLCDA